MKKIAEKINGKTKTRYIYDIVATILIIVISFKMDFLNKQGQILGWTFN
jgi:hypothetical protein